MDALAGQAVHVSYVVKWFVKNAIDYLQGEQHIVTFYVDRAKGHPRTVYTILDLETFLRITQQAMHYQGKKDGVERGDI